MYKEGFIELVGSSVETFLALCRFLSTRVNCYDVLHSQSPFGGFKMSGSGREL